MNRKVVFWAGLWLLLVIITGVLAFGNGHGGSDDGSWRSWGHMGGWQKGYQSEIAPGWYGMGPGMMGDSGYGWGRENFTGMVPWLPQNMTEEQTRKVSQLLGDTEKANSKLKQQRREAQDKLRNLYSSDNKDWPAIHDATMALADLQKQHLKAMLEMQQNLDDLLTDNQRQEMTRAWRGDSGNRN